MYKLRVVQSGKQYDYEPYRKDAHHFLLLLVLKNVIL